MASPTADGALRLGQVVAGAATAGTGLALMIRARLGAQPWDALHLAYFEPAPSQEKELSLMVVVPSVLAAGGKRLPPRASPIMSVLLVPSGQSP